MPDECRPSVLQGDGGDAVGGGGSEVPLRRYAAPPLCRGRSCSRRSDSCPIGAGESVVADVSWKDAHAHHYQLSTTNYQLPIQYGIIRT